MLVHKLLQSAGGSPSDPNFENVTLLLHGDGTNGGQNNTFVDGSTNNFTITRNGNTTQGSFSPYGENWSNYFEGTSNTNYLSIARLLDSTVDITLECWIYMTAASPTNSAYIAAQFTAGGSDRTIFTVSAAGVMGMQFGSVGVSGTLTVPRNQWVHLAWVRSGNGTNNWSQYLNGVRDGQMTYTGTYQNTPFTIGASNNIASSQFPGYISNLRLLKGTALYSGASFTPPSAPLTAITNTSLLTCQSNRFIDNSSNNFTITRNGDVSVQRFSPFAPSAAYSTATLGGSGYFDGSGDYLSAPNNTAFDLSTSDFTISYWIYPTSTSAFTMIATYANGVAQNSNYCFTTSMNAGGAIRFDNFSGNTQFTVTGGTVALNTWNFVTITRSGASATVYVNNSGTTGTVSSSSNVPSSSVLYIGAQPNASNPFSGYLSNFRIVKGSATAPGANPTSPLTAVSGTSILLSYTNAAIFDNAMMADLETVGNAQISTSVKKYGTGSLAFDGSGDWLLAPHSADQLFGAGNFTIELWAYRNSSSTYGLVSKGTSTTGWSVSINSSNQIVFSFASSTITSSATISATTWTHIAVVREGTGTNQTKIYIDGTNSGTGTVSTDFTQTNAMYVGANRVGGDSLNGYIDDLRITKGVARYTASFTAPTAPFSNK